MATVTRRFWIDLNDMRVTDSLNNSSPIQQIIFKARDSARVGVQFHRGGVPELLASGTTIAFGGKLLNDFGGDYLFSALSWTAATTTESTGQTDSDFYYATVNLNTTEVTDAIGDSDPQVSAMVEWELDISGAGQRQSTETITCLLRNDVNRGGEGQAADANPPWPSDTSQLIRYLKTITSLTGGTSADLDSIETENIPVPYVVAINNADTSAFETWALLEGTDAEDTGAGIVRPDDYASSTNQKVWYQQGYKNPMTTAGDIIIGGTGGAPTRLAAGTEGHALTIVSGVPAYAAPRGAAPTAILATVDANASLSNAVSGQMVPIASQYDGITETKTTLTIDPNATTSYADGFYFWAYRDENDPAPTISADVAPGAGVSLLDNGTSGTIALAKGESVLIWRRAINVWVVLSRS